MVDAVRSVKTGGPTSIEGKARSAQNAITHGLRAASVVVPGESAEEWIAHRDGVVAALSPANALEQSLVERVAEITWRMRRVAPAEAAGITKHVRMFSSDEGATVTTREAVLRYETHLSRQLALTIATLERVRLASNRVLED